MLLADASSGNNVFQSFCIIFLLSFTPTCNGSNDV